MPVETLVIRLREQRASPPGPVVATNSPSRLERVEPLPEPDRAAGCVARSAEVPQAAWRKALRISAGNKLYFRAGIVAPDEGIGGPVDFAVLGDHNPERAAEADPARRVRVLPRPQQWAATLLNEPRHEARVTTTEAEQVMAKAKFDISTQIPHRRRASALRRCRRDRPRSSRPVRDYVADVQKRLDDVQKSVSGLEAKPEVLRDRAWRRPSWTRIDFVEQATRRPAAAVRSSSASPSPPSRRCRPS